MVKPYVDLAFDIITLVRTTTLGESEVTNPCMLIGDPDLTLVDIRHLSTDVGRGHMSTGTYWALDLR